MHCDAEDVLLTPVHTFPVTTIRATWLDDLGEPDHPWAVVYRWEDPVRLTLARRDAHTHPLRPGPVLQPGEYLAHLAADRDHPERTSVAYLARGLQRPGHPKSVEAWAQVEEGRWWYALLPWWQAHPVHDRWPLTVDRGQELHAAGRLRPAGAYHWPAVCPLDQPHALNAGTAVLTAHTSVPPPPPGIPGPPPVAARTHTP